MLLNREDVVQVASVSANLGSESAIPLVRRKCRERRDRVWWNGSECRWSPTVTRGKKGIEVGILASMILASTGLLQLDMCGR